MPTLVRLGEDLALRPEPGGRRARLPSALVISSTRNCRVLIGAAGGRALSDALGLAVAADRTPRASAAGRRYSCSTRRRPRRCRPPNSVEVGRRSPRAVAASSCAGATRACARGRAAVSSISCWVLTQGAIGRRRCRRESRRARRAGGRGRVGHARRDTASGRPIVARPRAAARGDLPSGLGDACTGFRGPCRFPDAAADPPPIIEGSARRLVVPRRAAPSPGAWPWSLAPPRTREPEPGMKAADIRSTFLKFFESKGHQIVASSPVVPGDDPTLLFTNAGMKPVQGRLPRLRQARPTRATTAQKCVRAGGKHNERPRQRGAKTGASPHVLRDAGQLQLRRLLQEGRHHVRVGAAHRPLQAPGREALGDRLRRGRRGLRHLAPDGGRAGRSHRSHRRQQGRALCVRQLLDDGRHRSVRPVHRRSSTTTARRSSGGSRRVRPTRTATRYIEI